MPGESKMTMITGILQGHADRLVQSLKTNWLSSLAHTMASRHLHWKHDFLLCTPANSHQFWKSSPIIHANSRLLGGNSYLYPVLWNETGAQKGGIIQKSESVSEFPSNPTELILYGSHLFVANPSFKTADEGYPIRYNASLIDLESLSRRLSPSNQLFQFPHVHGNPYLEKSPHVPWDHCRRMLLTSTDTLLGVNYVRRVSGL